MPAESHRAVAEQEGTDPATAPAQDVTLESAESTLGESAAAAPDNTGAEPITQRAHPVDRDRRRALLCHLIKSGDWRQVLVFARSKHGANRLAEQLSRDGIESDAIHGNKSHGARTRALRRFKAGELQVLVATDIAARGLDIGGLPRVVSYDLPNAAEDYLHRIGRAGSNGEAVALVCGEERELLADIEKLLQRPVEKSIVAGFETGPDYETARFDPGMARGREADAQRNGGNEQQRKRRPDAQPNGNPPGPEGQRGNQRRPDGPEGGMRRSGPRRGGAPGQAQRDPYGPAPAAAAPRAEEFSNDDDIDSRIDGNRIDYPGAAQGNGQRGAGNPSNRGARNDFRNGQPRRSRPAPVLQGPMTSRGQPVASQNRPLEPHESRLHEYATRPDGKPGGKRSVRLTGLPRDED